MARTMKADRLQEARRRAVKDQRLEQRRELARQLRLTKQIGALTRQLERAIQKADRSVREFAGFVLERDGDFDVAEYLKVLELLKATHEIREGEDLYAAVQRLIGTASNAARTIDRALTYDQRPTGAEV